MSERLPARVVFGYALGSLGTTVLAAVLTSWIYYYYSPPPDASLLLLLSPGLVAAIRIVERILGAMIEPLVGHLSDRTRTRFGRRIPWIALGAPVLTGSFIAIWFAPQDRGPDDWLTIAYLGLLLVLFWGSFTAVVAPYLALLPELSRSDSTRLRLSTWLAVFEVLGNVGAGVGAALLVTRGPTTLGPLSLDNGFQLAGIVFGSIAFFCYAAVVLLVREPPMEQVKPVHFSLFEAAAQSLRNPQFVPYAFGVGGFRVATTTAMIGVPFIAKVLMGTDEETAGYMLAVIPVIAVLSFPVVQRLANLHGKAAVFRWGGIGFVVLMPLMGTIGLVPGISPLLHGIVLFVLSGFSVATVLVLPRALLADVIDVDETRTGLRREAIYNGMGGVVEKAGDAVAFGLIGVLFALFGNSTDAPLGLRLLGFGAAAGVLAGLFVFRRYGRTA